MRIPEPWRLATFTLLLWVVLTEEGNEDTCNYWEMPIDPHTGFCLGGASVTADGKRLAFMESAQLVRRLGFSVGLP